MNRDYDFTNEQIENRVLADCNRERLKEHRQCDYCHLCFYSYNYYIDFLFSFLFLLKNIFSFFPIQLL